jgi:general secretion pathway protein G
MVSTVEIGTGSSPGYRPRHGGRAEGGFTLVELMIVMLIIGVLAAIAIPSYMRSLQNAREAVLKEDLHVLRQQIDAYTNDKEKAPQSLDDLVSAGYLKEIPVDPMTHSNTTWVTATDDSIQSLDQTDSGIVDVHSGSSEPGSDGRAYSEW